MTAQANWFTPCIYLIVLGALWFGCLTVALVTPASWDVAWRLEIAQRILNKAVLYRDIIELNPPLWFWSALPSAFLSKITSISPYPVMAILIHLSALAGLFLLDRCVQPLMTRTERVWLVIGSLTALLLIPTYDIGQREPPIFLAGLLWAGLAARRVEGFATPIWLVLGITAFSAYGFALKHYYLIIPIGVEIWLAVVLKRAWRPIRLETCLLAVLGVAYGGAVVTFAPQFLSDIVPLVRLSYDDIRSMNVAHPLVHPLSMVFQSLLTLAPVYFIRDLVKTRRFAQVCLLVIMLHVVVIFVQGKGFSNHYLAAKGMAFVVWAYACGHASQFKGQFTVHPRAILGMLATIWIAVPVLRHAIMNHQSSKPTDTPISSMEAVVNTVQMEPQTSRVFVVSTNAGLAFYLQWMDQRAHFSRYYAMWMMPGLLTSQSMPDRRAAATLQLNLVRKNTIADIQCAAPHIIIGDTTTHGREQTSGLVAYDLEPMTILLADPNFKAWLAANYNQQPKTSGMTVWRPKIASGPVVSNCPPLN